MTPAYEQYVALKARSPELFCNEENSPYPIILDDEDVRRAGLQDCTGVMYEDGYIRLLKDPVLRPDATTGTYLRVLAAKEMTPGVAVLCRFHGKFVLVEHFRHALRGWRWEIPRGYGDPKCEWIDNATREAREEITGEIDRESPHTQLLGQIHPNSGLTGTCDNLVFAELRHLGEFKPSEGIRDRKLFTTREIDEMIRTGAITDGFTVAAIYHAKLRRLL